MTALSAPLSPRNPQVQRLRRLAGKRAEREAAQSVVLEGPHLLHEALARGHRLDTVFVTPDRADDLRDRLPPAVPLLVVEASTLAGAVDAVTPQGVAAIAPRPEAALDDLDLDTGPVLVLALLADPGNAGTLLRAAEAAGACGVVFTQGSVDPFSPKALRASAGSALGVPVVDGADLAATLGWLGERGVRRFAATAGAGASYDAAVLTGRIALVMGNEAHGLDAAAHASVDELVHIPMAPPVESLNVAVAGSILLFEVARARRAGRR
jgi:TrmH family RNA methyltransferase